jgi:hypothetical protein
MVKLRFIYLFICSMYHAVLDLCKPFSNNYDTTQCYREYLESVEIFLHGSKALQ